MDNFVTVWYAHVTGTLMWRLRVPELADLRSWPVVPGQALYPWEEWLDGEGRRFEGGVDFGGSAVAFRAAFRKACSRRGLRSRTRLVGEAVYGQAVRRAEKS